MQIPKFIPNGRPWDRTPSKRTRNRGGAEYARRMAVELPKNWTT